MIIQLQTSRRFVQALPNNIRPCGDLQVLAQRLSWARVWDSSQAPVVARVWQEVLTGEVWPPHTVSPAWAWPRLLAGRSGSEHSRVPLVVSSSTETSVPLPPDTRITQSSVWQSGGKNPIVPIVVVVASVVVVLVEVDVDVVAAVGRLVEYLYLDSCATVRGCECSPLTKTSPYLRLQRPRLASSLAATSSTYT